jgi:hypothetical protein
VKKEVATTADHAARLDKLHADVLSLMAKAQPLYRFDCRDFPLTKDDHAMFLKTEGLRSTTMPISSPATEQCLVIPQGRPAPIPVRAGEPFAVPLRLVFRTAQPTGRSYAGAVHVPGRLESITQLVPIPSPSILDGRADIRLGTTLSLTERVFAPATDTNGLARVLIYIVCRDEPGGDNDGWQPISYACVWPLAP